jgi:prolyl 4-hydroxylase
MTLEELTNRAEAGDGAAQYALAAYCSRGGRRAEADRWLKAAAANGEPEALFIGVAHRLAEAAAQGSPSAARVVSILRAMGIGFPLDDAAAIAGVLRLAEAGLAPAIRELAALVILNNPDDPEAGRLLSEPARGADWKRLAERASLGSANTPAVERLSASPDVIVFRRVVPRAICAYLMQHSAPRLGPAMVYDPRGGGMMRDPLRSSATASLGPLDLDLALVALNRRMSSLAGVPDAQGEFLSVMRYRPGEQYRPHFDTIPPGPDFDRSGQRVKTALLYLNDGYEGGETAFPAADLKVRGDPGDVVVFSNVTADGRGDPASRHAGLPVTSGEKWLASKWFRERVFDF